ncbi:MAG: CDGSH iron-sulfur domain-containing protein [Gemmatimonadota bacterium]|nr:MAG: CDGSH iron-sulfur domain-containing protein [Gemmatimonadota bacterium]
MPPGIHEYESKDIVVRFDPKRCIHAAECVKRMPAVFERDRKPWVDPSQGDADAIAAVVPHCPTGALSFSRKDGGSEEAAPDRNLVRVVADGPIYIHGDIELHTSDGVAKQTRVALCRCGAAHNKPYCDNSHQDIGFRHDGNFTRQPATAELGGPLEVHLRENGPIQLIGNLQLESGDGSHAMLCSGQTWMCRCGHSENKPFCDGAHKRAGFEAAGEAAQSRQG